ncbi:MAG TPA: hypothetical protein VF158_06220 [Longimicrobiales bacterium]
MRRRRRMAVALIACGFLACEPEVGEEGASPPAAEEMPLPARPEVEGYDLDSLAWFREGRPVVFETRSWRPIGQPLPASSDAFRRVGEFEGMALYAAADDSPPYDTLYFPLGNDLWQPLGPADSVLSERSP